MTLQDTRRLSKHFCRLLKVPEVHWTVAKSAKGPITIAFNENNDDFTIFVDSVALSTASTLDDENNIELKKMVEKYLFSQEKPRMEMDFSAPVSETTTISMKEVHAPTEATKKKGGRPKGSLNKPKAHAEKIKQEAA